MAKGSSQKVLQPLTPGVVAALLMAALSYNAVLAVVNANLKSLTMAEVATCEALVLFTVLGFVLSRGFTIRDEPPIILGIAFFLGTLLLSFINEGLVIEALRNVVIIVLFTMLGIRSDERGVRLAFFIAVAVVLGFMILEMAAQPVYTGIFKPFVYYQNTRGLGEADYGDVGLFGNALGFEGRFSFGIFTTPRTSSIFLEQTSLANFASVIIIYLVSMWPRLSRAERWLSLSFVILALLSNNTRMSSAFAVFSLVGYFVYPRFARYGTLILPLVVLGLALVATWFLGPSKEDDFAGRLGLSIHLLSLTDLPASLGARAFESGEFPDSGYSYVLYSSSVVGAVVLWLYVALVVPFKTDMQKRCAWALGIFFFMNLLVAGNAVFSMKVAAPLWLLAGFLRSPSYMPLPKTFTGGVSRRSRVVEAGSDITLPAAGAARGWTRNTARPAKWKTQ